MSEISQSAEKAHADYKEKVSIATNKAILVYPELFASKKDYSDDDERRVQRMNRGGFGVPFSVAFESVMGYSFDVYSELADEPVVNLYGKTPEYLDLVDKIFDQPMPEKGPKYYSTLRTVRKQMKASMVKVELERLKQNIDDNEAAELRTFVDARLEDVQKLLPK